MSNFANELERDVASVLWGIPGRPYVGIVQQLDPDNRPEIGTLLHGVEGYPFISVCSILPERVIVSESFTGIASMERTVTVVMMADKKVVENDREPYRLFRQRAFRHLNLNRTRGAFASDPNSCVLSNNVVPRAPFESSSWRGPQRYTSAFDVLFRTREAVES